MSPYIPVPLLDSINQAHQAWRPILTQGLERMDSAFLRRLAEQRHLPTGNREFAAFSISPERVRHVLLGESPYPREASAIGYSFLDGAVDRIWSPTGLSKPVNRATSLRNLIKMLLVAEGHLDPENTGQAAIASLRKTDLIQGMGDLRTNLVEAGFLMLNTCLSLDPESSVRRDAKHWEPLILAVLGRLKDCSPRPRVLLFGRVARNLASAYEHFSVLESEHPYNLSFIQNPEVLRYFSQLRLLQRRS